MKIMKKIFLLALILGFLPILQSCNDESSQDYILDIATVKTIESNQYYLKLDNSKSLRPGSTLVPGYTAVDGQRVLAGFTPLDDINDGYDYVVRINSIYNILTKPIEDLNSANEQEFGNDPINIPLDGIWIGSDYLNIEFYINVPISNIHKISLVNNTDIPPANDGYLHLELRYNTYDDISNYVNKGIVSFNLADNGPSSQYKGIKLKINSALNGHRELLFNYSDQRPVALKEIEDISLHLK